MQILSKLVIAPTPRGGEGGQKSMCTDIFCYLSGLGLVLEVHCSGGGKNIILKILVFRIRIQLNPDPDPAKNLYPDPEYRRRG